MNKLFSVIWDGIKYEAFLNRERMIEYGMIISQSFSIELNSEFLDISIPISEEEFDWLTESTDFIIHRFAHDRLEAGKFSVTTY